MSRYFRKTPIHGLCGSSEKEDKKIWHRKMRKAEQNKLATVNREPTVTICVLVDEMEDFDYYANVDFDKLEEYITTLPEDVSNPWSMAKDGKYHAGTEDLRQTKLNPRHCDAAIANLDDRWVRYTWLK